MRFSDILWQSTESIYKSILTHPFNTELAAGTLTPNKFEYYVQQDGLYIKAYARALALLAAKAPSSEMANELLSYAKDGILIEHMLHDHFFKTFHIDARRYNHDRNSQWRWGFPRPSDLYEGRR